MKNHIVIKFIAILLCAAALLGAAGSILGITVLTEQDLYDKPVDQVREEVILNRGQWFASGKVVEYATETLGGWPAEVPNPNRYTSPYFRDSYYSYRILDSEGTEVASGGSAAQGEGKLYTFPVSGKYSYLVSVRSASERTEEIPNDDYIACEVLTIPGGIARLTQQGEEFQLTVSLTPEDSTDEVVFTSADESVAIVDATGKITAVGEGDTVIHITCGSIQADFPVIFKAAAPAETAETAPATEATEPFEYDAWDTETWARIQSWIQEEWNKDSWENDKWDSLAAWVQENWKESQWNDDQWAQLHHWIETEWNKEEPAETTEATVPETEPTVPETEPTISIPAPVALEPIEKVAQVNGRPITDYEVYTTNYYDEKIGEEMYAEYVLLDLPGEYTVEMRILPGAVMEDQFIPLLKTLQSYRFTLFTTLAVSLLLFAALMVYLCCAAGRKPWTDEVRAGGLNRMPLELYALAAVGYLGFAAMYIAHGINHLLGQNLTVGLAVGAGLLYSVCLVFVGFLFAFVAQIKTPGRFWLRNSLCGHCWRLVQWWWRKISKLFPVFGRWAGTAWVWVRDLVCFVAIRFARLFTMLPLVWQWIIIGLAMLLALVIGIVSRSVLLLLIAVTVDALVVLYGAYAFGRLLDGIKRMGKGDLDTHVEDRHLVGGFRVFAQNLNALADAALVAARKQLKSERMKTELITNVSHDIKTPLTSIINYVDLLQKAQTEEEREQYLEVLSRQSQQLKKLIEDLIEMSKASTGNMSVDIIQVDAVESVNQALGEFADKLDKAMLTPVFRHTEDAVPMMADGKLVWRVLHNLLSNAVKYALPGTRLYIDLMQVEGKVILSMKNVSRDELNIDAGELMERFVRGDGSRNTEGSGLGLNIAKSMMELQKGQLQLLVDGDLFKVTLIFPGI